MQKQFGSRSYCPPATQILHHSGASPEGFRGYPVALSAQVSLNPSEPLDLPPESFTNQTAFPIDLYSMRWIIDADGPNAAIFSTADLSTVVAGAGIEAMIQLGDRPLTVQFVPLYLFGKADSQIAEQQIVQATLSGFDPAQIHDGGSLCSGQWNFDYPLTLEPGETLNIRLLHKNLVGRTIVTTIVFAGRGGFAGQNRTRRRVPYVATWIPPPFNPASPTAASPSVAISTPRDLVNKSGGPISVRRFVGRLLRTFPADASKAIFDAVVSPQTLAIPFGDITVPIDAFLTVVANDSRGNAVVAAGANNLGAPFRLVFEPTTRAWEVPHHLEPDDYYLFKLTLSDTTPDAAILGTSVQPAIAMIGYQEVA